MREGEERGGAGREREMCGDNYLEKRVHTSSSITLPTSKSELRGKCGGK